MREAKTIKGFLGLLKPISYTSIAELKGFNNLTKEEKFDLYEIQASCENISADFINKQIESKDNGN